MKKFSETISEELQGFYSLNALFAEELNESTDLRYFPADENKVQCTLIGNKEFEAVPFYKHISRMIKNNYRGDE